MTSGASATDPELTASVVVLVPAWRVDRTFDYDVPPGLAPGLAVGSLVRVPFGARTVRAVVVDLSQEPRDGLEEVSGLVLDPPVAPPPLDRLHRWVARRYVVSLGRAFERCVPPRVRLKSPEVGELEVRAGGGPLERFVGGDALSREIARGQGHTWVLRHTGVARPEDLVCDLAAAALGAGGAALVAVPEVRFGSRTLDALAARWPAVARVDSGVGDPERSRGWLRLALGHRLGFGARGALVAPVRDPALLVVTEEAHPAYKDDRAPRIDARRVASERAALAGGTCVLMGSAPSVESVQRARSAGTLIEVDRSAERAAHPVVETVAPPHDRVFARLLHRRIQEAVAGGNRVALLAAQRGYARALWCAVCSRSLRCPRCESGLFFDRVGSRVNCGRCGLQAPAPEACPNCGGSDWRYLGAGSERLADQVAHSFPRARVARMDPDVIEQPVDLEASDIYVTTWIGTKPQIRPDVTLVGVLNADGLLRRPDWRATESAYQALAAMAEWAGPRARGGRLVVQTEDPAHYVVQAIVRGDYRFFYDRELAHRQELGYPPFVELIRVTAFGPRRAGLVERCAGVARHAGARVLGPVDVVPGVHEGEDDAAELLIKCAQAEPVCDALRVILADVPAGSRLRVDVDPR